MDTQKMRFLQDLLVGLSRRDPEVTLQALSGLLSDPESPLVPAEPRARRTGRHRQWVASLGFSSLTGVRLSRRPILEPLRMPLGLSLEYLFKDYGIHLMLFPMDFAPDDSGPGSDEAGPESGGLPATPSALALGFQVGLLKLHGDHPWTVGVDLRFLPTPRGQSPTPPREEAGPRIRRARFPGTWQVSGFTGFHFPLLDLN